MLSDFDRLGRCLFEEDFLRFSAILAGTNSDSAFKKFEFGYLELRLSVTRAQVVVVKIC